MNNIEYLTTIKKEYQEQLNNILTPHIYSGIKQLYKDVKDSCKKRSEKNIMSQFQQQMKYIPQWNIDMINREAKRIIQKSQCEYLQDLVAAVFLSNTKILSATSTEKNIDVNVPTVPNFIHSIYQEVARGLYSHPDLIRDYDIDRWEETQNYREVINIITSAIDDTIRKHLPFKNILTNYLDFSINQQKQLSKSSKRKSKYDLDDDSESEHSYESWDTESFTETEDEMEELPESKIKNVTKVEEIIVDDKENIIDEEEIIVDDKENIIDEEEIIVNDEENIIDEEEIIVDDKEEIIVDDEENIIDEEEIIVDDEENIIDEEENDTIINNEDEEIEEDIPVNNDDNDNLDEHSLVEEQESVVEECEEDDDEAKEIIDMNKIEMGTEIINIDDYDNEKLNKVEEIFINENGIKENEKIIINEDDIIINDDPPVDNIKQDSTSSEEFNNEAKNRENVFSDIEKEVMLYDGIVNNSITEDKKVEKFIESEHEIEDNNIKKVPISSNSRRNLRLVKPLEKKVKKKSQKEKIDKSFLFFEDAPDYF